MNTALNALNLVSEKEFPNKVTRQAEMRFLRGHFYFLLKILFKNIPFVDETVPEHQYQYISNVALTDVEMWDKIIEDFKFAFDNLPEKQADLGLSLIHISEPTRLGMISYAVFCLKKKKKKKRQ